MPRHSSAGNLPVSWFSGSFDLNVLIVGSSALSPSQRHGQGQGTSRSSPDVFTQPRRLFLSPDVDDDGDTSSEVCDTDNTAALMRRPGQVGPIPPPTMDKCDTIDDKEYQNLMAELRATAERVLREDDWKYRPSEEILGFP